MAARLNPKHSEQVLERIKLAALVTMLQKDALGQLKNSNTGEYMELSEGRRRSAIFLIERKLAKAEAPKDLNLHGDLKIEIIDPTRRAHPATP